MTQCKYLIDVDFFLRHNLTSKGYELTHPVVLDQYLRISVIAIARFGLFRSPDPAVFLSSY
ncbi:hypothetical protein ACPV54_27395, partial [Vibrio mediterranei]